MMIWCLDCLHRLYYRAYEFQNSYLNLRLNLIIHKKHLLHSFKNITIEFCLALLMKKQGHVGQWCVWFSCLNHSFIIVVIFVVRIIQIFPSLPNIAQAYSDLPGLSCMPGLAWTFLYAWTCQDFPVCPDLPGLSCMPGIARNFLYTWTCPDFPVYPDLPGLSCMPGLAQTCPDLPGLARTCLDLPRLAETCPDLRIN